METKKNIKKLEPFAKRLGAFQKLISWDIRADFMF